MNFVCTVFELGDKMLTLSSMENLIVQCNMKAFIQNLVQNGSVVSEKIRFEFLYVHDLGPRSRNDIDLKYSHSFIKSFSCLYLPTFRSLAAMVSGKLTVFTFSY